MIIEPSKTLPVSSIRLFRWLQVWNFMTIEIRLLLVLVIVMISIISLATCFLDKLVCH